MKELKSKDLNFIKAAFIKEPTENKTRKKTVLLFIPILLLVAGLGSFGVLQIRYLANAAELNRLMEQIATLSGDAGYQKAVAAYNQITSLSAEYDNANQVQTALDSYPDFSKSFFTQVEACITNQITVSSYDYSAADGLFVMSGKAVGIVETAAFVRRLRNLGLFSELNYTGYSEEQVETAVETTSETDEEIAALQKTADTAAATAAANPEDVSAQLAAQIAAMQLASAKSAAKEETEDTTQVTVTGSGNYLFEITGILKSKDVSTNGE